MCNERIINEIWGMLFYNRQLMIKKCIIKKELLVKFEEYYSIEYDMLICKYSIE